MVLSSKSGQGGAGQQSSAPPFPLLAYIAVIVLCGATALVAIAVLTPWAETADALLIWPTVFLAVAAVVGEVMPIQFARRGAETRSLSTSAPFVLALIPVAGLGVAVGVQLLASLVDDVRFRRSLPKSLFNSGQYILSVTAAGVVFALLTDRPIFGGPVAVTANDLLPILAAGVAMIAVNWLLVATVVTLATQVPIAVVLREDVRVFVVTNIVLLSVGGLAAMVAADGIGVLILVTAPVIAAHIFAATAAEHAHDATHDPLTGLGNRGQLHRDLDRVLAGVHAGAADGASVVLIDLDHFKDFNDTLGHPVGDLILREVAHRLIEAAPEGASVHRLGGDEFAIVLSAGQDDAQQCAEDLLQSFDVPVRVDNLELLVRGSAGLAIAPEHGDSVETLMKNADIALYHAKLERDRISIFTEQFDVNSVERLQLLADLHTALDNDELRVVYQPQFDLADGTVVAVEALVRWQHPSGELIPADEFVPLAENSGLIFPLTDFVLNTALSQAAAWHRQGHHIRMSVNLAARHLSDLALPQQISQALARHKIEPSQLVLEVTETGILSDPARADVVIKSVRELGVAIAIDDYGTGNASLSYLKRLDIDELKVDRTFVTNLGSDRHDRVIVRSTIDLALALGLRVVAEGIEDERTAQTLATMGHVIGQGRYLAWPASAQEVSELLKRSDRSAVTSGTISTSREVR
ncbi:putative bifunctional diguanylate cyclase/phosphodiesterase [Demequina flava]|uniref:putative bifunctional diguanylate cyclase/phosphodiesterase n=1 Tax=Demequina flava TaxID=1095025 RepID=UPI0007840756|nr:GGDEF domain-containing phosphodiesterase [Demequina flava]